VWASESAYLHPAVKVEEDTKGRVEKFFDVVGDDRDDGD
jgi:hypothetical protein